MRNRLLMRSSLAAVFSVVAFFSLLVLCSPPLGQRAFSAEMTVTDSFDVVAKKVESLADKYGPEEVLLVCDIDNTLLTMNQELGGEAWFYDQFRLLRDNPKSEELVASDFSDLLRIQTVLYTLSRMHPPEKMTPLQLAALQKKGIYVMLLTARGPASRNATEVALLQNQYHPNRRSPKVADRFRGDQLPYQPSNIASSGISRKEAKRYQLGKPRTVCYDKGLYMVAGQHKGAMLLIMLAHCTHRFSAIVFVDDKEGNVKDVFTAAVNRNIDITAYRYSREDRLADIYKKTGHKKAHEQWKTLQKTLNGVFE